MIFNGYHGKMKMTLMKSLFAVGVLVFAVGCSAFTNQNRLPLAYSATIGKMQGGVDTFWPNGQLRNAFVKYWAIRYSDDFKRAYQMEAPYFREIIGKDRYETVVAGGAKVKVERLEIRDIQKINQYLYEIGFSISIKSPTGETNESFFKDRWIYAGDCWYHVMHDRIIFPAAS